MGERLDRSVDPTMMAVCLLPPGGLDGLKLDRIPIPQPGPGEALVRVHAAAITRNELDWPVDRLPAIPSYELSGEVEAVGPDVSGVAAGDEVWGMTEFNRNGVAAAFTVVPTHLLVPKPRSLNHAEAAALPLSGLSAWQGLFNHGGLAAGQRVLILGGAGGVGHLATQLARWRGAHVVVTASKRDLEWARDLGAHETLDRATVRLEELEPVDLVFDTVGGDVLQESAAALREGGRLVSVAEEPPAEIRTHRTGIYFVVEPNRDQLAELARLADAGDLKPAVDSEFALAEARAAFDRSLASGKRGKVVLRPIS